MIYLDNAATTKVRAEVLEAMLPYLQENYGNPSSVYALGREAHHALDVAREQVRAALNAKLAREIFFTGCGTESDNWAIMGAAHARRKGAAHHHEQSGASRCVGHLPGTGGRGVCGDVP